MEVALSLYENNGNDIGSDRNLSDLKYADDTVPLIEDPSEVQIFSVV